MVMQKIICYFVALTYCVSLETTCSIHVVNRVHSSLWIPYLDLLACCCTLSVILKLLFDKPYAEAESQKHGPVTRGPASEPPPEASGLKLGCQALQSGAIIAVSRRQESLRLNVADRRAYTKAVSSELCCDSATGSEETHLKDRPAQLEPPANGVFYRHNLPGKVT